jgi:hypothetical protein
MRIACTKLSTIQRLLPMYYVALMIKKKTKYTRRHTAKTQTNHKKAQFFK